MKRFLMFIPLMLMLFFYSDICAGEKVYKLRSKGSAGGWIFYDKGKYTDGWRYLEAAPEDQSKHTIWGCSGDAKSGANGTAIGTGKSNTRSALQNCGTVNSAARLCADYRGGGKNDWFLPSKDELNLMYLNLKKQKSEDLAKNSIGARLMMVTITR